MKKNVTKLIPFLVVMMANIIPVIALAKPGDTVDGTPPGTQLILNPLKGDVTTLTGLLQLVIDALMYIAIPVIVIMFIYTGLKFVMARGNSKELEPAKDMFKWLVIGSAIILASELILKIVENTINSLKP